MPQPTTLTKNAGLLARLMAAFSTPRPRHRKPMLDARMLSDHLKRDMGFLDVDPTTKRK